MKKPSVKSIILATIVALLVSWLQPSIFMTSMFICIAPIAMTALYAWGGWIPAAVLAAGTVGSLGWFASLTEAVSPALAGLGAAVVLVLPGVVGIVLLEKRLKFFHRMMISIGVQTAALLACVSVVYLGMKVDLVDAMMSFMRTGIEQMPTDLLTTVLQYFAMYGILTEESITELTTGIVLWSDVERVLDQAFEYLTYQFRTTMPAFLMFSGLVSGILTTTIPSRICARRGEEPQLDHVPMHQWFLPAKAVGCTALCWGTGIAMQYMNVDGALALTAVFSLLGTTLCMIQGIAALSRRFREVGTGRGVRIALIAAGLLFAATFVELYGALSALFGRKGAISSWMRKRTEEMENNRKDDDE